MIRTQHKARLMQTCREDGLLLKADRPAFPIETVYSSQVCFVVPLLRIEFN